MMMMEKVYTTYYDVYVTFISFSPGSVYYFLQNDRGFSLQSKLRAEGGGNPNDFFGASVAVYGKYGVMGSSYLSPSRGKVSQVKYMAYYFYFLSVVYYCLYLYRLKVDYSLTLMLNHQELQAHRLQYHPQDQLVFLPVLPPQLQLS
jgi:hypothetical protein